MSLPRVDEIGVDAGALVFATAIALACPFAFGLVPALRATRKAVVADIRGSGGTPADRVRAGRAIAAGQLAISIVLLIASGLLGESLVRLSLVRPGFNAANLLTFSVSLPGTRYHRPDGTDRFIRELEDRVATLPNVRGVGTIWPLPLSGRRWAGDYVVGISPTACTASPTIGWQRPASSMRLATALSKVEHFVRTIPATWLSSAVALHARRGRTRPPWSHRPGGSLGRGAVGVRGDRDHG